MPIHPAPRQQLSENGKGRWPIIFEVRVYKILRNVPGLTLDVMGQFQKKITPLNSIVKEQQV